MAVTTYQLPQRFELVNELDSFDAGVRLIPYGAAFPVGSMISANLSSKLRVPGLYLSIVGSGFQVIGYALLSTLDSSVHITPGTYGYEVLCGLGCGMTYQMMYLMVPFTVGVRDKGAFFSRLARLDTSYLLGLLISGWNGSGKSIPLDGQRFWAGNSNGCV
jgi:hypothetical protein